MSVGRVVKKKQKGGPPVQEKGLAAMFTTFALVSSNCHSEDLMRIATLADVDLIKNILLVSFKNDPHVNWLLEESKNKSKLNVLIDYRSRRDGWRTLRI